MYQTLEEINNEVIKCTKCKLCKTRKNIVFSDGNNTASIMFIGEGPGADEEEIQKPFVGEAGQLLNQALKGVGIKREDVYITNVLKCRPYASGNTLKSEIESCLDYLRNQVMLIKPKIVVLLGNTALKSILGGQYLITSSRGKWIEKKGIKYFATYHPSALLHDESKKIEFWNDLKMVVKECNVIIEK